MPIRLSAAAAATLLLLVAGCSTSSASDAPSVTSSATATPPAPSTATPPALQVSVTSSAAALTPTTVLESTPQRVAPTTATGEGIAAGVDRTSADAVATAVLTVFFTADTTVDEGPNAAAARASALLTPAYAATIMGSPPVIGAGAQWQGWAARGVQLSAEVTGLPDDRPADTATTAFRIDLVTQTPTTASGQALAPVVVVAYVALQATHAGWAVANIDQR